MSDYIKQEYYSDDDMIITIELMDSLPFFHVVLNKANKNVLDKLAQKFGEVRARAYFDGYEAIYTYTKDDRLLNIFKPDKVVGDMVYRNEKYKVAQWDLN